MYPDGVNNGDYGRDKLLMRGSASANSSYGEFSRRGLPDAVRRSWDWAVRTDPDPRFLPRFMGAASRFRNAVERRLAVLRPHRCPLPPDWRFDMAYSRFEREERYVARLRQIHHADVLREHAEVDPGLLVLEQPLVWPGRGATPYATNATSVDPQLVMPLTDRTFERKMRHKYSLLVPTQCKEITALNRNCIGSKYVNPPPWWVDVEVPYGDRTEMSPAVTYLGSRLMGDPLALEWKIVRTEWAALVAANALYQARAGFLCRISPALQENIQLLGVGSIVPDAPNDASDLAAVLQEIRLIRWDRVSPENRQRSEETGKFTPVFEG